MALPNVDWQHLKVCYDNYSNILKAKADTLKKEKQKLLIRLDDWYQQELPATINKRTMKYIKHDELCKLMQWKLTRGKFRPRLTELVKSNDAQNVESVSKKAFSELPDVMTAVKTLTTLKAVGPATASAILAAVLPEKVPFMADESMLYALPGRPKLYTIPYFLDYMKAVNDMRKLLKKSDCDASQRNWSSHQIELALWASSTALALDLQIGMPVQKQNVLDDPSFDASPKKKKKRI
ncbi:uncharacterized protein LOC106872751 [Argonauta hians]